MTVVYFSNSKRATCKYMLTFWEVGRIHKILKILCKCSFLGESISFTSKPEPQCPVILQNNVMVILNRTNGKAVYMGH